MKRKVITSGRGTYIITLPLKWVKKHNIQKGNELEVVEDSDRLCVSAETKAVSRRISINLVGLDERVIRWYFSALQKAGYDEIEVFYGSRSNLALVDEIIKDLYTGFAVIKETKSVVLIKSISSDKEDEFDAAFRRAFRVTITMAEELFDALKGKNCMEAQNIRKKEQINNQLTNFCQRLLNKYQKNKQPCFLYAILWNLEKICDNYKYICDYLLKNKDYQADEKTLKLFFMCNEILICYYDLFYGFDLKKLNSINQKTAEIRELLYNIKTGSPVVNYLAAIAMQCSEFSASIIALNH